MNWLLAAGEPPIFPIPPSGTGISTEVLTVLGAVGAIVVGFLIWALFIRKRPDGVEGWGPSRSKYRAPTEAAQSSGGEEHRRRHRRRRREHRPMNPTLAETGGLPPVRSSDPSSDTDNLDKDGSTATPSN